MTQARDWMDAIPALAGFDADTRERLRTQTRAMEAPAGTRLFGDGSPCQAYLMVLAGQVRVQKVGENGREIVLYRVEAGETCVVTTACLMSGADYDAEGIAETPIQARALPVAAFRDLLGRSACFRDFVFKTYGTRIADLLMLIEEVAFGRLDQRLAAWLLHHTGGDGILKITHQDLAAELGTAREVVSRQLKEFERRGWVRLGRGSLEIAQRAGLEALVRLM